ncbi:hypothetical protein BO70DRAFT_382964 [Aspergillus heteromorphus CBS 117.55]|uniref:GST C-terminal domain-containing protein n=1 Tax=Aspergillus heteromorphus CBS 117.55 TaxID=1448321 RepID=A0A317V185_9EURO|nr:uncharacterized protein BO70DRAFT_382964 [Aspergillus heteromorphus CBS 117.55]PWY67151.1 hypothetical protein BO70DRAFT_382964 [Aspergillus heteromorphus CBS 117.55]
MSTNPTTDPSPISAVTNVPTVYGRGTCPWCLKEGYCPCNVPLSLPPVEPLADEDPRRLPVIYMLDPETKLSPVVRWFIWECGGIKVYAIQVKEPRGDKPLLEELACKSVSPTVSGVDPRIHGPRKPLDWYKAEESYPDNQYIFFEGICEFIHASSLSCVPLWGRSEEEKKAIQDRIFAVGQILIQHLEWCASTDRNPFWQPSPTVAAVFNGLQWMEDILRQSSYLCGATMTAADIFAAGCICNYRSLCEDIKLHKQYPRTAAWLQHMYDRPGRAKAAKPFVWSQWNIINVEE